MIVRLKEWARALKRDVLALWLAARDPRVPRLAKLLAGLVTAYALSPIDLIPDFIPVLGLLDDAILIPLGVWLFLKMVPADVYARERAVAEEASHRPVSRIAAAVIALLWLGALVWAGTLIWTMRFY